MKSQDIPDEPSTTVGKGAVLSPGAEMMTASDAFPAGTSDGTKVVLTSEEMLVFAAETVT